MEVQPQSLVWVVLGPASLGSAEPQPFDRFLAFGPPDPDVPADVVARLTGIIESRSDAEVWRQRAQDLLASPQDDPERRIRALEQQLTDPSRMADDGRSAGRGARAAWIALAVIAVGLAVSGVVIVAQWLGRSDSASPGPGPVERSSPSPTPPVPPVSTGSAAPQNQMIVVTGIGTTRTIGCARGPVSISGAGNTVVLTGECSRVEVSGVANTVTVETAEAISVSGTDNRVRFRSGQPAVESSGTGNTVERG